MKRFARFIPAIFMMFLIFYLSSFNELELKGELAPLDFFARKIAHMTEYATLTILIYWPLSYEKLKSPLITSGSVAFIYALTDELHQAFVPGRSARIFDIGIDTLGILVSLIIIKYLITKFSRYDKIKSQK